MSLIKLSSLGSKILIILSFSIFLKFNVIGAEPIDIWKKDKNEKNINIENKKIEKKSQIDYLKKNKEANKIKIVEDKQEDQNSIQLSGLYDPQKNDLNMSMWANTDGSSIKNTFNRITKIKLSNFSEQLFIDTIFTYSYPTKINLTKEEFLKLKLQWLVKNNKINLIEEFLNMNLAIRK